MQLQTSSPASVQHEQTTVSPDVDCPHSPRCPQCGGQVRGWSRTMRIALMLTDCSERCEEDADCKARSDQCCVDVSQVERWRKTCCSPQPEPLLLPPNINNLTEAERHQLDTTIASLSPVFLDVVVCEGLQYSLMETLSSCEVFLTTTARLQQLPQTDRAPGLTSSITVIPLICLSALPTRWTTI